MDKWHVVARDKSRECVRCPAKERFDYTFKFLLVELHLRMTTNWTEQVIWRLHYRYSLCVCEICDTPFDTKLLFLPFTFLTAIRFGEEKNEVRQNKTFIDPSNLFAIALQMCLR